MLNLKYSDESILDLKKFIDSYKLSFIKLIQDSGLIVEDQLINNYIEIGNRLYKNIIDTVENNLNTDIILGRKIDKYGNYSLYLNVNNFRLHILYSDDLDINQRIIISIKFNKK